jgi:hypothetical protein
MDKADVFWHVSAVGWTALTGVGTLATAAIALVAAIVALNQYRESVRERQAEARPYVVADMEPGPSNNHIIDFVLKNIGKTPAYDLALTWVNDPVRATPIANYEFADMQMFKKAIPMLAPGRVIRVFFDVSHEREDRADLESLFELRLRYRATPSDEKTPPDKGWIEETLYLDLDIVKGAMWADTKGIHQLVLEVEKIQKKLR